MSILLDTHIWLWFVSGDKENVKPKEIKLIEECLSNRTACLSSISIWELSMLYVKKRILIQEPLSQWVDACFKEFGFHSVELNNAIAMESCLLPDNFHGDPADRMIVATARVHGLTLLTKDDKIKKYAKLGHVRVI